MINQYIKTRKTYHLEPLIYSFINCLFHINYLSLPCLHAETSSGSRGGGGRHISNGVFLRFGFDDSKSWKNFQIVVKDKATKNDVGYVVSIQPLVCSLAYGISAR